MGDVSATGSIVNNYRLKVPMTGAKECDAESIEKAYQTVPGQQMAAADVLVLYFFGTRSFDKGKIVFDAKSAEIQPAPNVTDEAKEALLHNPKFLAEVYQSLAEANGGSLANLSNKDGSARDTEYGDKLYTCGAKDRWFWENPNRGAIGTMRALWLTKDRLFNNEIGSLPNRKVPIDQIGALIAKYTKPVEAPRPAIVQVATPVIDKLDPKALTSGTGNKEVKMTGRLAGVETLSLSTNCVDAISFKVVSDAEITLTVNTDALKPTTCSISAKNSAGESPKASLKIRGQGGAKPKPTGDLCTTNPEACL